MLLLLLLLELLSSWCFSFKPCIQQLPGMVNRWCCCW
jgi:hypothetical protein